MANFNPEGIFSRMLGHNTKIEQLRSEKARLEVDIRELGMNLGMSAEGFDRVPVTTEDSAFSRAVKRLREVDSELEGLEKK